MTTKGVAQPVFVRNPAHGLPVKAPPSRLLGHLIACAPPDQSVALAEKTLGRLMDLGRVERRELLDTLHAWIAAGGSTRKVGEVMHCHRNTAYNRLRRIERLTGRSLTNIRGIAELFIATEILRLTEKS